MKRNGWRAPAALTFSMSCLLGCGGGSSAGIKDNETSVPTSEPLPTSEIFPPSSKPVEPSIVPCEVSLGCNPIPKPASPVPSILPSEAPVSIVPRPLPSPTVPPEIDEPYAKGCQREHFYERESLSDSNAEQWSFYRYDPDSGVKQAHNSCAMSAYNQNIWQITDYGSEGRYHHLSYVTGSGLSYQNYHNSQTTKATYPSVARVSLILSIWQAKALQCPTIAPWNTGRGDFQSEYRFDISYQRVRGFNNPVGGKSYGYIRVFQLTYLDLTSCEMKRFTYPVEVEKSLAITPLNPGTMQAHFNALANVMIWDHREEHFRSHIAQYLLDIETVERDAITRKQVTELLDYSLNGTK